MATARLARVASEAMAFATRESDPHDSAMASFFAADSLDRQIRYAEALVQYARSLQGEK